MENLPPSESKFGSPGLSETRRWQTLSLCRKVTSEAFETARPEALQEQKELYKVPFRAINGQSYFLSSTTSIR